MKTVSAYLKEEFGKKIYKISLDGGFSCPNRDGRIGYGGCIFCSGRGSGDFAADRRLSVTEQLAMAKQQVKQKNPEGYIAYFQAFTNTYAPVERLKKLYEEALSDPEVLALSIATRPDCLPDEVCKLLKEINEQKPVWVELGLQSMHEKTARYIRRGYELSCYEEACRKLVEINIPQRITHVILGLPGESEEDMLDTVRYVTESGANGIKLQLLHILKGTELEEEYRLGRVEAMEFDKYISLVVKCLKILPEDFIVHRITGDGPRQELVAPLWSLDKKRVLNAIRHDASLNGILI